LRPPEVVTLSVLDSGVLEIARGPDGRRLAEGDTVTEDRNRMLTPIDGVVIKLARDSNSQLLANGQLVSIGQVVAQIAPLDPLVADVDLIGDDIALVRVGLEARARSHAWGAGSRRSPIKCSFASRAASRPSGNQRGETG
jgi:HlyD family secretion protein